MSARTIEAMTFPQRLTHRPARVGFVASMLLVSAVAGFVFFYHLGNAPLNDWDEAWHAQVAREILSTGDWLTLHCRGEFYFNKPPLTFWLKAIAFRIGGVNETSARFFPALFGWGTIVTLSWFLARAISNGTGVANGMILCTSWLFVTYHTGRSAEADSTLVFFVTLTFIFLWQARQQPKWFYLAAVSTALGWMSKGATAYLPWVACAIAALLDRAFDRSASRWRWRHAIAALGMAILLTVPWQTMMVLRYGHAFTKVFYLSEGAGPALTVTEDHPGNRWFYLMILHQYFQPWTLLAGAGLVLAAARSRSTHAIVARWLAAWAITTMIACTLFATKMVWYLAPALPPIAGLAGVAVYQLARRSWGWVIVAAAAGMGVWQCHHQDWSIYDLAAAMVVLTAGIGALLFLPLSRARWEPVLAAFLLLLPLAQHFHLTYRTIARDEEVTGEAELRNSDEPWRELAARLNAQRHDQIVLVDIDLEPAVYFYLSQMTPPPTMLAMTHDELVSKRATIQDGALLITRIDWMALVQAAGAHRTHRQDSLIVLQF